MKKDRKKHPPKTVFMTGIPPELYLRFKASCAAQGRTMKDLFIDFMKATVRK